MFPAGKGHDSGQAFDKGIGLMKKAWSTQSGRPGRCTLSTISDDDLFGWSVNDTSGALRRHGRPFSPHRFHVRLEIRSNLLTSDHRTSQSPTIISEILSIVF